MMLDDWHQVGGTKMLNVSQAPQTCDPVVARRVPSEVNQHNFREHEIPAPGSGPALRRGSNNSLPDKQRLYETLSHDDIVNLRRVIFQRQQRYNHFDGELFADPGWDIILTLAFAEIEQRRVTTSELCAAAAVPVSTGLRWIYNMVEKGALIRRSDPLDRRRVYLELTEATSMSVRQYVHCIRRSY